MHMCIAEMENVQSQSWISNHCYSLGQEKNTRVSANMLQNIRVGM